MSTVNVLVTSEIRPGFPNAFGMIEVALMHGGTGGAITGTVYGGSDDLQLDANGQRTLVLERNTDLTPEGTSWRVTALHIQPIVQRYLVLTDETPDDIGWEDESILVLEPPPIATGQVGPPGPRGAAGPGIDAYDRDLLTRAGMALELDPPAVVHNLADRTADSTPTWPDGSFGFVTIAGTPTLVAADGSSVATATLDTAGRYVAADGPDISGLEGATDYAGGGPIYDAGADGLYLIYHGEEWSDPSATYFWSFLGLAHSTDDGATWTHVSRIVEPERSAAATFTLTTNTDVGGGPFTIADGYLYVWFKDMLADNTWTGASVARCLLADIEDGDEWHKWDGVDWSEPALGGTSASVVDDDAETRWLEAATTEDGDTVIVAACHPDGWSVSHCTAPAGSLTFGAWVEDVPEQAASIFYVGLSSAGRYLGRGEIDTTAAVELLTLESVTGGEGSRWADAELIARPWNLDGPEPSLVARVVLLEEGEGATSQAWTEVPSLSSSWVVATGGTTRYYRHQGRCYLYLPTVVGGASGSTVLTLPAGYRPDSFESSVTFSTTDGTTFGLGSFAISTNGVVQAYYFDPTKPVMLGGQFSWRLP